MSANGVNVILNRQPSKSAERGAVQLVDELLDQAIRARASDVHIEPTNDYVAIRFRIDGMLHESEQLPNTLHASVVARLKVIAGLLSYRQDIPQEGATSRTYGDQSYDLRISSFPTIRGERVAVRVLARGAGPRPLEALGFNERVLDALRSAVISSDKMICLCGPAGSGKTTTLYALLNHLRQTHPQQSFMTVEDPVEMRLDGVAQIQVSPHGELTFARALRSILRQDPQVLLIGEIRDRETAEIAVEAALTGHLVLTSLHSGSPTDAIVRLLEMKIAPYQLTSALGLVVSQRLLRTICVVCGGDDRTEPCANCLGTGLRDRVACAEALMIDQPMREAILQRGDANQLRQILIEQNSCCSLADDAQRHLHAGRTIPSELERMIGCGAATENC